MYIFTLIFIITLLLPEEINFACENNMAKDDPRVKDITVYRKDNKEEKTIFFQLQDVRDIANPYAYTTIRDQLNAIQQRSDCFKVHYYAKCPMGDEICNIKLHNQRLSWLRFNMRKHLTSAHRQCFNQEHKYNPEKIPSCECFAHLLYRCNENSSNYKIIMHIPQLEQLPLEQLPLEQLPLEQPPLTFTGYRISLDVLLNIKTIEAINKPIGLFLSESFYAEKSHCYAVQCPNCKFYFTERDIEKLREKYLEHIYKI